MPEIKITQALTFKFSSIHHHFFLLFWLILNLIQAAYTEVHNDESYYWIYTKQLDWGYYDHPPMVALVIKAGYQFLSNEVGLRIGNVMLMTLGLLFFLRSLPKALQHHPVVYLALLAVPFLNYLGYLVFPDGALVAFGAMFLFVYQRWLAGDSWRWTLLMGLLAAALLYTKYHAAIFFLCIVLSNFTLLGKRKFYVILIVGLVLYIPHIWWQVSHGFPSIKFHLVDRSSAFEWKYAWRFVGEQLLNVGPVLFIALFMKSRDDFERALVFLVRGFFFFFLFSSLRGIVHIQWTSLAWLPAIFLVASRWSERPKRKWWLVLILPYLLLTTLFRLVLLDIIPREKIGPHYVQGQEEWYRALGKEVGDRTLVFHNDLKEPSAYEFYTGKPAMALYPTGIKKSQYDLWQLESTLTGKSVVIASKDPFDGATEFSLGGRRRIYLKESRIEEQVH